MFPIMLLLGLGLSSAIVNVKYSFPKHLINTIFIIVSFIVYPLALFKNKKLKYLGVAISIIVMLLFGLKPMLTPSTYETSLKCSDDSFKYDDTYKAYLEDSSYGNLNIEYIDSIESYCIHASFKKPGDTKVILENPNGNKQYFNISIGKNTYSFND